MNECYNCGYSVIVGVATDGVTPLCSICFRIHPNRSGVIAPATDKRRLFTATLYKRFRRWMNGYTHFCSTH